MLISIIVPVYNVDKYLIQCLDSLLHQTYKDIEVIMVDDGSTDLSGSICDQYAELYKNFKVIHKKNNGLGMARNTGLEYIKGTYVSFVDADDYLEPSAIETLYNGVMNYQVDMCKGGMRRVMDNGKVTSTRRYDNECFEGIKYREELFPRMIASSPTQHDSVDMCVCGALYNVAPIKKYGLIFVSERTMIAEDLVFNLDYAQYANGGCLIDYVGYDHRINTSSLTTSYRQDRFEAYKYFYLMMRKRCLALGYDKDVLLRLSRMFFIKVRQCISQEKIGSKEYGEKQSLSIIEKICSDNILRQCISDYPIDQLEFRPAVFLELIRRKSKRLLLFLAKIGIL